MTVDKNAEWVGFAGNWPVYRSKVWAMKMKIPNGGSGNGYYGHETGITASYVDNSNDPEPEVQATGETDFSEYLWMENEEEFDKQVHLNADVKNM